METIAELAVQEITWAEKTFVCKRLRIQNDKMNAVLDDTYRQIYQTLQDRAIETELPPFAIHYSRDEARGLVDLAAAVPVHDYLGGLEGFEILTIPASKALRINHYGSYDTVKVAYNILEKHMLERGFKRTWLLEQYFTDTNIEKDPGKWKTSVYFLLK